MSLIRTVEQPQSLSLTRDLTKHLKRGHRWVFANSLEGSDKLKPGIYLLGYKKDLLGIGLLQPDTQLRFRLFCLADEKTFYRNQAGKTLDAWSESQWQRAFRLRQGFDLSQTNSFRLVNGEGDGMPGLVVDVYGEVAVIKHDHPILEKVWNGPEIAKRICQDLPQIKCVYLKRRNDDQEKGLNLIGELPDEVQFLENGKLFATNIRDAAKTGFFLDQRDNRAIIQKFSKDAEVLNLFSYTGGFSIYAAAGGAKAVTSVDISAPAIRAVERNFSINGFKMPHTDIAVDAFQFVEDMLTNKTRFDLVITDPPSFAPNEKSVPQATAAYIKIFSQSIRLVREAGLFAASSCSSHIPTEDFLEICRESFSKAGKKATLIYLGAQPSDHPYPLAMPELRYLKFALFRVEA